MRRLRLKPRKAWPAERPGKSRAKRVSPGRFTGRYRYRRGRNRYPKSANSAVSDHGSHSLAIARRLRADLPTGSFSGSRPTCRYFGHHESFDFDHAVVELPALRMRLGLWPGGGHAMDGPGRRLPARRERNRSDVVPCSLPWGSLEMVIRSNMAGSAGLAGCIPPES